VDESDDFGDVERGRVISFSFGDIRRGVRHRGIGASGEEDRTMTSRGLLEERVVGGEDWAERMAWVEGGEKCNEKDIRRLWGHRESAKVDEGIWVRRRFVLSWNGIHASFARKSVYEVVIRVLKVKRKFDIYVIKFTVSHPANFLTQLL
jgi:hypothetical protein